MKLIWVPTKHDISYKVILCIVSREYDSMIEPLQYRVDDASCIVCACIPVGLNQLRNVGKNIYCKLQHTHTHHLFPELRTNSVHDFV